MKKYSKIFKEGVIKTYSDKKEIQYGSFITDMHDDNRINKKSHGMYFDNLNSGLSLSLEGSFEILKGAVIIKEGKNYIAVDLKHVKEIDYGKDGTYYLILKLNNSLTFSIDFR